MRAGLHSPAFLPGTSAAIDITGSTKIGKRQKSLSQENKKVDKPSLIRGK
jgi:hypothetical protein